MTSQEDAHEFISGLLDACHSAQVEQALGPGGEGEVEGATARTTGLWHLFGSATRQAVVCASCGGVSHRREGNTTFCLPISARGVASLEDALRGFFCREELSGDNACAPSGHWRRGGCVGAPRALSCGG